jgi:uncharacterized protein (DUF1684 family)
MNRRMKSLAFTALALLAMSCATGATSLDTERADIQQWRARRLASLTSDTGWLNLVGLFWLDPGENTFGRNPASRLVLDNEHLAGTAGSFFLTGHEVRFVARPGAHITHDGQPVTSIDLVSDAKDAPTVLASGSLQFYVIERDGHVGIRARDIDNPKRRTFKGLEYFPVSTDWAFDARFEPYEPHRHIRIVNILGMEEEMDSPGAVVFSRDGKEWRLDAILESPGDTELFLMFADGTSAHETYGAGRFLYVPLPRDGRTPVDFNKAYNPPCAFSNFATCPLPPPQNRLKLRVEAGEKKYESSH